MSAGDRAIGQSTEYLSQIINCIKDPIFVTDSQQRLVFASNAFCALAGMTRDELLGKAVCQLMPDNHMEFLWNQNEHVLQTGSERVDEGEMLDSTGNKHALLVRKVGFTDKARNGYVVGVIQDVTERKRLEMQFLQAQKFEAIGVLAGGVAHDFNNWINVINGYSEMMLDDLAKDDPKCNDLEQIHQAGQRAASLTSQLLIFSQKQIPSPQIMNLNEVIADLTKTLRRFIGEDIQLICKSQPDLGLIHADHGQIQQIVLNLAVNARCSMPKGGKLAVETANIDMDNGPAAGDSAITPGSYVLLSIAHDGIGIDSEAQSGNLGLSLTAEGTGGKTGLGFSAVYKIIKQSGGFVLAEAEPGKGTTFRIYFPREKETADEHDADDKIISKSSGAKTVLVVEDEPLVRSLTVRILREKGYRMLEAPDGSKALALSQEHVGEIHLVLTDVVMPTMSGKELVEQISAFRPKIKVLYVSGYADDAILSHGPLDSSTFLQKPFTADSLVRKVQELVNTQ